MEQVVLNIENLAKVMRGREATDWMLPLFWSLAAKYPKAKVGEIGFRGGTSALAWAMGVAISGGHVWSMDINECLDGRQMMQELGLTGVWDFIHGDSTQTDFPEPLDILYIDGDHRYSAAKADYQRHVNNVKDGGVILFHDTRSCPGVGMLVREVGGFDMALGAGLGIKVVSPNA